MPGALVKSVVCLCEGVMIRTIVDSELSEEFDTEVGVDKQSVLSPLPYAVVVDVVTELLRQGELRESLYPDNVILITETVQGVIVS